MVSEAMRRIVMTNYVCIGIYPETTFFRESVSEKFLKIERDLENSAHYLIFSLNQGNID